MTFSLTVFDKNIKFNSENIKFYVKNIKVNIALKILSA